MAYAVVNQSGNTNVIQIEVQCYEEYATGNYRTIYLGVKAIPSDGYTGARDGKWSISSSSLGISLSSSSASISGDGVWLYEGHPRVYVSPGSSSASVDLEFSASLYSSAAGGWRTVTGSCYSIAGLSILADAAIEYAADIDFGDAVAITWTPPASTFSYKLKFTLGDYSEETGIISPNSTAPYTYTGLTIPLDAMSNIPNSYYGTMTVTMTQYSNYSASETVGAASSTTFRVYAPDSAKPTITSNSVTIDNSGNDTLSAWGVGVVGFSGVHITAAANGVYGSTIKSFTIAGSMPETTINGEGLDYVSTAISTSGNKVYTIYCTDSRGMISDAVTTDAISISQYTSPKITKLESKKNDNGKMVLTATWEIDSIGGHNSATGAVKYKVSTASDWTDYTGTLLNGVPFTLANLTLVDTASYNFKVVVTDAIGGTSEKDSFASTTTVLLDFRAGGKGLGIGKICEADRMEVSMEASFYNDVSIRRGSEQLSIDDYIRAVAFDAIYPVGSIYMSLDSTSPQVLFSGTWEPLEERFLLGAGGTTMVGDVSTTKYTAGTTGGEETHILTIDEMPQHNHAVTSGSMNKAVQIDSSGNNKLYPAYHEINTSNDAWVQYEGYDEPHNNMPPYLVVYMWKRTA